MSERVTMPMWLFLAMLSLAGVGSGTLGLLATATLAPMLGRGVTYVGRGDGPWTLFLSMQPMKEAPND